MTRFFDDIRKFNDMYGMEKPDKPVYNMTRANQFEDILREEVAEFTDIWDLDSRTPEKSDVITAQADLYGDIIIYCASEMHRIGLNPEIVLSTIMQSNFSKLGEDGKAIYDERGKLLKGPNYWKPEPELKNYIELAMAAGPVDQENTTDAQDCNGEGD